MTVPDEEVFAFVDGELPPEAMARIEAAMATDPQLALRVETQRSLRRLLSGAHGGGARQPEPRGPTAAAIEPPPPSKPAEVIAFPGAKAKDKPKDRVRKDRLAATLVAARTMAIASSWLATSRTNDLSILIRSKGKRRR